MELLLLIGEALLWIMDFVMMGADVYSWIKGKDNRHERKIARRAGEAAPPRDKWNRRVIVFSLGAVLLTWAIIYWRSR